MRGTMTAAGLVVMAIVVTGCTSDDSPAAKKTAPPSVAISEPPIAPVPGRSATPNAGQAALATYRSLWAAATKAALTSDHDDPELRKFAHDDALAYFVGSNLDNKEKGLVVKGEPSFAPHVTQETASSVSIADCLDDSRWLKYRTVDGQLENNVPGGHHRTEAVVTLTSVGWRVTKMSVEGVGTC